MRKRPFRKPGSGAVLILFAALTAFGVMQCTPDLGMPSWDLKLTVPFSNQRYGLDSLVGRPHELEEDGGGIDTVGGSGGLLRFYHIEPIDSVNIADSLLDYNADDTTAYPVHVKRILIDSTESVNARIGAGALIPGFTGDDYYDFVPLVIPQTAREVDLEDFDSLRVIHVMAPGGGSLNLRLTNNTGLHWTEINVDVHLDEAGYPFLGSTTFSNVDSGEAQLGTVDLAGDSVKQSLVLYVDGYGNDTTGVFVSDTDGLDFSGWVEPLSCDYVLGFIKRQPPILDTTVTEFEDEENWIIRALVTEGVIDVHVANHTDTEDSVYIKIPNIISATDTTDTLCLGFYLEPISEGPARAEKDTTIYLDSMLMVMELPEGYDTQNPEPQEIEYYTTVHILSGGRDAFGRPRLTEVTAEDSVHAEVSVRSFEFDWMWGVAKDERIDLDSVDIEISDFEDQGDLQRDLSGNLMLDDAQILIDLTGTTVESPAKLVMDVTAINTYLPPGQQEMVAHFERWISPGQDSVFIGGPYDNDTQVRDLINHLPNHLLLTGDVRIGRDHLAGSPWDPYQPYPLRKDDMVVGNVVLEAPLQLSIEQGTPLHAEVDSIGEGFEAGLQSVRMMAVVRNTVPLGGSLYLLAGSFANQDSATAALQYDNLATYALADPITVPAPQINPNTNRAMATAVDTLEFAIGPEAMATLTSDSLFMRQIIYIEPTPQSIAAYETDGITVSILAEVEYRVNEEDDE